MPGPVDSDMSKKVSGLTPFRGRWEVLYVRGPMSKLVLPEQKVAGKAAAEVGRAAHGRPWGAC